jgi:hypothetical protein
LLLVLVATYIIDQNPVPVGIHGSDLQALEFLDL